MKKCKSFKFKSLLTLTFVLISMLSFSQGTITVKGTVTDKSGESLIGVTVIVESDPSRGTVTDIDGKYTLSNVPATGKLVFSYVGMEAQIVPVKSQKEINIVLGDDTALLDEVVIVGYGTQEKTSVVSSVSTIQGNKLNYSNRNLTNNLAGQVAGLIAIQRSGEPGYDNSEFWIRGISTFAGGSSPLVLVDGVPRKMSDIEPDEVETFTVLKDAAATAVYGAEGANGVVIITSKRGRALKPVITFRTEHTLSQPTRLPKFVGSADYLTLFNEALLNDGELPIFDDELIGKYANNVDPDLYPSTDWLDAMLKPTTTNHRYTLNVRGGSDKSRYFVSGAYFGETGIFKGDPNDRYDTSIGVQRYNLRSNIDLDITNTTLLRVDISGQYLMNNFPGTGTGDIFRMMLLTPPHVFPPVYSDGTISTHPKERDSNMRNPYNLLMNTGYAKEWRSAIQSNISLEQKLDFVTEGLLFKGNISYDYDGNYYSRRAYNPSRYYATGRDDAGSLVFDKVFSGSPDLGDASQSSDAVKRIYVETSLNYKKKIQDHTMGGMLLFMQKETHTNSNPLPFRKQGFVGRVTYGYDNRYFVEGNFGYTGSETFAKGNRFGFFPAVGLGYQVSNEPFYPRALKDVLSDFKLRLSAGRTGNDDTGGARFLYRPTFNMGAGGFNQGITSGGASNGLGNGITEARFEAPYLSWEIEDKQNFGIDLGFLKNKFELSVDYFNSERSDILLQRRTIPSSSGFRQAPWENFGKVKNWGFDGSLNAYQSIGDFIFSARGTFTFSRNKILEYDELPQPYPWMAVTGTRVSENTLYIAERLYTDDDFIITQSPNGTNSYQLKEGIPKPTLGGKIGPGDIKYEDINGDGVIDNFDKKRGVGNPYNPELVYGFGLNVEYKNFYVSAFFQGVGNTSIVLGGNNPAGWYPFAWGVDQSNFRTFALDRWTPEDPRQDVLMPRLHRSNQNSQNNSQASTWWLRDGSFLRFKNFEFGYNIPKKLMDQLNMKTARVYVMGNNLFVWDKIKHWDPETGNSNAGLNYPLSRTFTLGLELSF